MNRRQAWLTMARAFDARANGTDPVYYTTPDFGKIDLAEQGLCRATAILRGAGKITIEQEITLDAQAETWGKYDLHGGANREGSAYCWWTWDRDGAGARAIFCTLMALLLHEPLPTHGD